MADWHGVKPLLLKHLKETLTAPSDVLSSLEESCRQGALHNLALASELLKLSGELRSRRIEHLAYKGPLLAATVYGDLALRLSNDLDLVVPREKLQDACQVLTELGYRDKNSFTPRQQRAAFRYGFEHTFTGRGGLDVDLHWRVVPTFVSASLDDAGIWQRAVAVPLFGRNVPTFCPEDLIVALCLHAGQHEWMQLSLFCDLARTLQAYCKCRWDIVRSHLGDSNTRRIIFVSLCLLRRHWTAEIPADLAAEIAGDREVQSIADIVEREFWPAANLPEPTNASWAWLLRRTRGEHWMDRLRYVAGIALNPTNIDYETFKLPRPAIALYPLLRAGRLALTRSGVLRRVSDA
jgi:hypothetical protein